MSQEQPKPTGTEKIQNKVDTNKQDEEYKNNLKEARRLVALASPIIEKTPKTQIVKDANGKEVEQTINVNTTTGYNYYAVNGKPLPDWIKETFGGKVTLDEKTNTLKVNEEKKS